MEKRRIGRSDLLVAPLCLGGNVFGWSADEAASFRVLDAFVEAGFNFIDTADVYSAWVPGNAGGESEAVIGKWMKARGNRDAIVLTTKVGSEMGPGKKGLSRRYIAEAVEASLKRLQTDVIDLYLSHWEDPETPYEETLAAYADLVKTGKVRFIGNSNHSVETMRHALAISAANGWPRFENLQTHYNLYDRAGYEAALETFCRDNGIGVTSYFSLAKGFLSGKYRSEADFGKSAARGAGMKDYLNPRGLNILAALDEVSAALGASPAQVAIAWLIARPGLVAPIASATSLEQLGDLLAATRLTLDRAAVETLDAASA
ncbi:aldo/keto reductase [Labrys wisconsinensis]|uniref:Aryl-alcohol dehydrogenase-like predicted oxidoreductase n=1 Tax=Labrys wisconsinensis TaxID=425677 RepID=A0ABU0JM55_9HYPH|nr:aldo/keto reductase [Labrys wisconsinensis]MDQ0475375.1 aryl-alcohol dehydrogenase-like predicted oxidoreductase [Labrys wisconsinensis]